MYACVHTHTCIPFPSVSSARAHAHTHGGVWLSLEGSGMAAGEAGFVSHHAAGRSPQCGQPPQVPGPSLPPSHSLLPPRTPEQTDTSQGTLGSFPSAEQV